MNDVAAMTPAVRFCVKGRDAARVIAGAGFATPARPNSLVRFDDNRGWCLRLGNGEYLLAHDTDAAHFGNLAAHSDASCHSLLRADRCLLLSGAGATARLLQICDIDERGLLRQPDSLALVLAADVGVTLHAERDAAGLRWRLWCDATWFDHLHAAALHSTSLPLGTFSYEARS